MTDIDAQAESLRFEIAAGTLAALRWGRPDRPRLIALHGWLDNAASFAMLGPRLAREFEVIALDLPGHGQSFHRPPGESYEMLDYVRDLALFLDRYVGSEGAILLGHSLGGILASLLAVAAPDRVRGLITIDSLGPMVGEAGQFPTDLRKAVDRMRQGSRGEAPSYSEPGGAVEARMAGRIPLSRQAAEWIVPRNLQQGESGWFWVTDPRLRHPSLHRLEEPEVAACLGAIDAPVLIVRAATGMLTLNSDVTARRYDYLADYSILDTPGGHHCHLDGDVDRIADGCSEWLTERESEV